MRLSVVRSDLFRSELTNLTLPIEAAVAGITAELPRQLPLGVSEADLAAKAADAAATMRIFVFV